MANALTICCLASGLAMKRTLLAVAYPADLPNQKQSDSWLAVDLHDGGIVDLEGQYPPIALVSSQRQLFREAVETHLRGEYLL